MKNIRTYQTTFNSYLNNTNWGEGSDTMYEPIQYILENGGKRFRPVLTLLAGDSLGEICDIHYQLALGIEMFHNFTLLHDDIMDQADLRRGKPAVHKRYGTNAAILSGDLMLIIATQIIHSACQNSEWDLNDVLELYLKVGQEICEGQDLDMHLQVESLEAMAAYEEMVRKKTAVLLGFSLYAGARAANISKSAAHHLYAYGVEAGVVFQMWDDYLDVFSAETTGKRSAGDIYNKKETCLILKLREAMSPEDNEQFQSIWSGSISDGEVIVVKDLLKKYDVQKSIKESVERKLFRAKNSISLIFPDEQILPIIEFTDQFISRTH
jgi:geranylgeranyl diphosphate synthase type II